MNHFIKKNVSDFDMRFMVETFACKLKPNETKQAFSCL